MDFMARDDPVMKLFGDRVKRANEQLPSARPIFTASPFNRAATLLSADHERA
jgi:hypothetical protein